MYARVVVLTYQAPDIEAFTYKIPKALEKGIKAGQLVEIPFGKRNPAGVITDISSNEPNTKGIKAITNILLKNPIILPYQVDLLKWMANYYQAPMVNCLEAILPEIPKRLTIYNSGSAIKSSTNQSLVLVPSINRIAETLAKFPKAKSYAIYHNELKTSEKFATWLKLLAGDTEFVFGSRNAIFAPLPDLKEIIIYNEHDSAYKDERSPYFDTLTVAQKICELTKAQIKIVDHSPKISTFFQLKSHIKIQKFVQKTDTVDMKQDRLSGNKSSLSLTLQSELEKSKSVLLFLNKIKESGHLFCTNCKNSLYLPINPAACPQCQSSAFFWNSLNVTSLTSEVKRLFPKRQVKLLTANKPVSINNTHSIDIGTSYSLYAALAKKYDMIAHIQTDSLTNIADFSSGEQLFAQITSLKKLLTPTGKLILQTYNDDNMTIQFAANNAFESFYQQELRQRELLSYPPFSLLVKFTFKGKNPDKVTAEGKDLYDSLNNLPSTNPNFLISPPYQSIFMQRKPTVYIICKYKLASYDLDSRLEAVQTIMKLIGNLPRGWLIEVEPNSIQ